MKLQRMVWFVDRFAIYAVLFALLVGLTLALAHELWLISMVILVVFLLALYLGLVRIKILTNSVVVCDGKVLFFVPETIVRNRFDFASRGQRIVELPEFQLLDRPFKVEIFLPGREGRVGCCRLSLRFEYLVQPEAWQRAYDSFVTHGERLPLEVKRVLQKSCAGMELTLPVAATGDEAMREYLAPVVAHLNRALAEVGLEVVEVQCSFAEGPTHARLLGADQQEVEKGVAEEVFRWRVRKEEGGPAGSGGMLEVPGKLLSTEPRKP